MYDKTINILKIHNIELSEGLNETEIIKIQNIYKIRFPKPFQKFLKIVVPIGKGFYDWRDFSDENISFIREVINRPKVDLYDMANEIDWCEAWGTSPINEKEKIKEIREKLLNAPSLIPIYAHRYMPVADLNEFPIISVHGLDIIYYGKNLENYFEVEFYEKEQQNIAADSAEYIPFWTDLM